MLQDDGYDDVIASLFVGIFTAIVGWIAYNIAAGLIVGGDVFLLLEASRDD